MPLTGMIAGQVDFSKLKWVLSSAGNNGHEVAIRYGNFIQSAMNFFIVSLCIFIFILIMGRNPNKINIKGVGQNGQGQNGQGRNGQGQNKQLQKTNDLLEEIRDALKNKQ